MKLYGTHSEIPPVPLMYTYIGLPTDGLREINRLSLRKLKLKLIYDRQSVGQSVLVSGAHLGPLTNCSLSLKFPSDICLFVIL
jgi:hypothetical protein